MVHAARDQHDEHPIASLDGASDDGAIVRRSRNHCHAVPVRSELADALLPADANHLVAAIKRVLDHVLPELSRRPDDAYLHRALPLPGLAARDRRGRGQ